MTWQRHWVIRDESRWTQVLKALLLFRVDFTRHPVELIVRDLKKGITYEQRGLFHAVIADVAPFFDLTPADMKRLVMAKYAGAEMREVAGIYMMIVPSTEDLSREQYSALIETTFQIAAEQGINVPDRRPK